MIPALSFAHIPIGLDEVSDFATPVHSGEKPEVPDRDRADSSVAAYSQFCLNVQDGVVRDSRDLAEEKKLVDPSSLKEAFLSRKKPLAHFIYNVIIYDKTIPLDKSNKEQEALSRFLESYADKYIMNVSAIVSEYRRIFSELLVGPVKKLEEVVDVFNDDLFNDSLNTTPYYQKLTLLTTYSEEAQVALSLLYNCIVQKLSKDDFIVANKSKPQFDVALRLASVNIMVKAMHWQVKHLSIKTQSEVLEDNIVKLVKDLKKAAPTWFTVS